MSATPCCRPIRVAACCFAALVSSGSLAAETAAPPRVFEMNPATLARLRTHPDKALLAVAIRDADQAMKTEPHSVMDKKQTPPRGDKHDWYTQAG